VLRVSLVGFKSWLNETAELMQIRKNKWNAQVSNNAETPSSSAAAVASAALQPWVGLGLLLRFCNNIFYGVGL
jgi:hypothetical protein